MTRLEYINSLLPVLYPKFYTLRTTGGDELVLLRLDNGEPRPEEPVAVQDKTAYEARHNQQELFQVNGKNDALVDEIGQAVIQNMLKELKSCYPRKKFMVYLTLRQNEWATLRFHQAWPGEMPYYDAAMTPDPRETIYTLQG